MFIIYHRLPTGVWYWDGMSTWTHEKSKAYHFAGPSTVEREVKRLTDLMDPDFTIEYMRVS